MILAVWTDDEAESAVIDPSVAHDTGQAESADAIRPGLKARRDGDEVRATAPLGRAVQIAADANPETMRLFRKVVEIQDETPGTVKLLKGVRKEDEFALDTRSTKTAAACPLRGTAVVTPGQVFCEVCGYNDHTGGSLGRGCSIRPAVADDQPRTGREPGAVAA